MNKLEQRLIKLTKELAFARENKNQDEIERLEDEIEYVEFELEEFFENQYSENDWN